MTYTPGYLIVGEYFDKRKALAMAICNVGTGLGTLIFPTLILVFFNEFGYEGTFLVVGAISLNCCVSGALFRPLNEPSKKGKNAEVKENKNMELTEIKLDDNRVIENRNTADGSVEEKESLNAAADTKISGENYEVNYKAKNGAVNDVDNQAVKNIEAEVILQDENPEKEKEQIGNDHAKKGFASIFDVRLLKDRRFMCLCLVVFSCAFALALTSGFLPALAIEKGIGETEAVFLLSISGISSTIGGLGIGVPLDFKQVRPHRVKLYGLFAMMVGIATMLNPFTSTYAGFVVFTLIRAGFAGVIIGQRATLAGDLVGPKRVPTAFGWILFAHSLGSLIGRASGGKLVTNTVKPVI